MNESKNVELTKDELEVIMRALITQDAVNGIVNTKLANLIEKFGQLLINE